jgi:hypothetical protein
MTTLKEIYRNHGYEVNRDDQKGIGNKCLENVEECFKVWLTKKQDEIIEEQKLYGFDPLIHHFQLNCQLMETKSNVVLFWF